MSHCGGRGKTNATSLNDSRFHATLGTHGLADTSDPDAAVRVHSLLDAALGLSL